MSKNIQVITTLLLSLLLSACAKDTKPTYTYVNSESSFVAASSLSANQMKGVNLALSNMIPGLITNSNGIYFCPLGGSAGISVDPNGTFNLFLFHCEMAATKTEDLYLDGTIQGVVHGNASQWTGNLQIVTGDFSRLCAINIEQTALSIQGQVCGQNF